MTVPKHSEDQQDEIIAELSPSPVRRMFGIFGLTILGAILVFLAITTQDMAVPALSLAVVSVFVFVLAYRMKISTSFSIVLKKDGLYSSGQTLIAPLSNIRRVEIGAFAFKPSNGFAIILNKPMPASWNPGLWWRVGKRVGIGGVTHRAEARILAETLKIELLKSSK